MMRLRRSLPLAGAAVALAAVSAGGGAATYAALSPAPANTAVKRTVPTAATPAAAGGLSVAQIARQATPGVVEITVETSGAGTSPFGQPSGGTATGSGFVYDREGHIVTNEHVVDGATSISVTFADGTTRPAKLVGSDASTDLAVIDVDAPASQLTPLALGDSGDLVVGDPVVAIGSPFGLEDSVTSGIVSALGRQIGSPNNFTIDDAIQTDAAINHGNSGGPLLDAAGRVVGVNAQIESDSGGNDGVGFAIPSTTVEPVVEQLISAGRVDHAYLGVAVETVPQDAAAALGIAAGAEVADVRPGTPAARAGLRGATGSRTVAGRSYPTGGDVIIAVGARTVETADDVTAAIDAARPGDTVSVTVVRDGQRHTVDVTLATRPS